MAEPAAEFAAPPIERLCRYLSDRSPQPLVAVDGQTHVVSYLNPAFGQLVGKRTDELVGRAFAAAVPEGDENGCLALLDRVFRTGIAEQMLEQEHRQGPRGSVYWSYSVWAILSDDRTPVGVMIQITDSTEYAIFRRRSIAMNEALVVSAMRQHELAEVADSLNARLKAAVETRDHFIAVLSHELRNPLAAFSNGLHLLKMAGENPISAAEPREMMERQLKRIVRLVDDLLDISRIATGKLELRRERIDLAEVLRDAVEASRPLVDLSGHELTFEPPPHPIPLDADPVRLGQVFLNLLNNAAKYSERGGRIRLSTEFDGDEVAVRVRDTGIGIPVEHLPRIFDVFVQVDTSWQRAQGGMGIGLSLVKEYVELHGGRVEAASEGSGTGSEFVVRLPASRGSPGPGRRSSERSRGVEGVELSAVPRLRILVVDDNRDSADSMAMMLEILGHEVSTAYDGEAGVAAAANSRPELILMDLGMPVVSGYEAARRIRAEAWGTELYLIALTGWGADEDRRRTRDAGFDRHLVKPASLESLAEALTRVRPAAIPDR